jgi:TRAP-type C4-dicarboxylate transport system permease small subunit
MFARIENKLVAVERFIAALSLLSLLLLSLLQILTRNFFDTGFTQIELLNRHLLIVAGLMGAGIATTQARHIKIDALNAVLSDNAKRWLRIPLLLFAAAVAASLSYYSVNFCLDEWQYAPPNERWALPLLLAYPASFASIALHFIFACFPGEDS